MQWQEYFNLQESVSGALSSQAAHTFPVVGGPVGSLALHYAADYAGDRIHKKLSKAHPHHAKKFDAAFKNPKGRIRKFLSDLTSVGGTAGGIALAGKLHSHKLAHFAGGVGGHLAGRLVGNALWRKKKYRGAEK